MYIKYYNNVYKNILYRCSTYSIEKNRSLEVVSHYRDLKFQETAKSLDL